MKKYFLSLTCLLLFTASFAQRFEVGFANGEVQKADQVRVIKKAFKKSYLLVDDQEEIALERVTYYTNEEGYFMKASPDGLTPQFYLRELNGDHIKTYSLTSTYFTPPAYGPNGMPMGGGTMGSNTVDYYQKDNSPLKKMNMANLKVDLMDYEPSNLKLKEVKTINTLNAFLYTAGAAMLIAGIVKTADDDGSDAGTPVQTDVSISPLVFVGAITLNIPWFTKGAKRRKMYEALTLYNEK